MPLIGKKHDSVEAGGGGARVEHAMRTHTVRPQAIAPGNNAIPPVHEKSRSRCPQEKSRCGETTPATSLSPERRGGGDPPLVVPSC